MRIDILRRYLYGEHLLTSSECCSVHLPQHLPRGAADHHPAPALPPRQEGSPQSQCSPVDIQQQDLLPAEQKEVTVLTRTPV